MIWERKKNEERISDVNETLYHNDSSSSDFIHTSYITIH